MSLEHLSLAMAKSLRESVPTTTTVDYVEELNIRLVYCPCNGDPK